ncbi:uracil-DNA glycosylase [Amnibacterium endophyticum]|uniref:Uracil-DNA glycosylase n=1 Tax=Amnibacterium endophyticum TaxID=2109337 RepID=A0ABW4LL24_9MICO
MLDAFLALLAGVRAETPEDAEFLYDPATAAGALRLANLERYLALIDGTDTALVGEAPGWRGATITGVPFMSVRELAMRPGPLTADPAGDGYRVPDAPGAEWELSASVVQKALRAWSGPPPVCWPVVPNHPFRAGDPLTNRPPRVPEVRAGAPVALELLRALRIRRVIAVGRKAEAALALAGVDAVAVRHPAQGGAGIFARQMAALAPPR